MPNRKDLTFVGIQAALLLALLYDPFPGNWQSPQLLRWIGAALGIASIILGLLAIFQLGSNLTPWPSPKENNYLVTTGTYGWARHPIYAAILGFSLGLTLYTGSLWRLALTVGLWLLFTRKARYEEARLRERFAEYADYASRVPRFGPGT